MRAAKALAAIFLLGSIGSPSWAEPERGQFGLRWGQSAEEVTERADASVLSWSTHQRFGQSFEVDRLPLAIGGEINRIVYFDNENHLLRIWVNFGYPGGRVWEENYFLDDALAKYRSLKTHYDAGDARRECSEPALARVDEGGQEVLDRSFGRNQTVWSCEYRDESTLLKLSLRRLGDSKGQRFDVIVDAQDQRAVAAYRARHPIRGFGHGQSSSADSEAIEISCEDAKTAGPEASPWVRMIQRRCEIEAERAE